METTKLIADFLEGGVGVAAAGVWGALWGSFFNVMIVRLPAEESLVRPGSFCRSCSEPLRWYDNVPILSYLALRGRCRSCKEPFSPRYALVEALVAILSIAMHRIYLVQGTANIELRAAQLLIMSLFCGVLVAVAFIDLATMRIPNAITYPGIPIAVALSVFMGHPALWDGLVGAVAGYLSIRVIADGYELITKRQGMGYGDAKLLAMIGGLLGWRVLLPTVFLSALQGSVIGIGALVIGRRMRKRAGDDGPPEDEEERLRYAKIPFGPFISLAAIEVAILRDHLPVFFPYLY